MAPRSVFITGANRGIGLGIAKRLVENQNIEIIIASCRNPENAKELNEIKDDRLHIIGLDVDNDDSIRSAFGKIELIVGEQGLTVLLNNAGVLVPYDVEGEINREAMRKQIETNAVSVAVMIQTFIPLLKKSAALRNDDSMSIDRAAIVNISSTAASVHKIDGTFNGPLVGYRMSKSALNSFAKSCSIDLKKYHILVSSFCPGWVKTDMGGSNAELTVDEATNVLVSNILRLDEKHHGAFMDRNLDVIPN